MSHVLPLQPWHRTPAAAHVVPLALFMLLTEVAGLVRLENSAAPWYQSSPEHWVYPVQCLIVGAVLLGFRRQYKFLPWRGMWLAAGLGLLGIAVWVLPSLLYREGQPGWLEWLGVAQRLEGFDPGVFDLPTGSTPPSQTLHQSESTAIFFTLAHPAAWWLTVALRFFRMVIIVPLVEELFWRGFLMRYLQANGRDFRSVPFGQHSWKTFWIVTLAVTLIHNPADYLGAFVWGSLMYFLAVRTKSLGACVFMHAAGNLLLGIYVLLTSQWGFW